MIRIAAATALLLAASAFAEDTTVRGHFRKDGTYVAPHHRTTPDSSRANNYGSQGNFNPYTGNVGTVTPYSQPESVYTRPPVYPTYQPAPTYQPYQAPRLRTLP